MTWRNIPGETAYLWIYDKWLESKPRKGACVIECGVALGKSVAYLCERCDAHGRDDIQIFGVDPFLGEHMNGEQQDMAAGYGGCFTLYTRYMLENAPRAFERLRILRVSSLEAKNLFIAPDLVILDNDHSEEHVARELEAWRRAENIGGDDHSSDFPGVERAVRARFGVDYEFRERGGPHDNPEKYIKGTWCHWGAL